MQNNNFQEDGRYKSQYGGITNNSIKGNGIDTQVNGKNQINAIDNRHKNSD